eukprot:2616287-Rhodomonas_salina.2
MHHPPRSQVAGAAPRPDASVIEHDPAASDPPHPDPPLLGPSNLGPAAAFISIQVKPSSRVCSEPDRMQLDRGIFETGIADARRASRGHVLSGGRVQRLLSGVQDRSDNYCTKQVVCLVVFTVLGGWTVER